MGVGGGALDLSVYPRFWTRHFRLHKWPIVVKVHVNFSCGLADASMACKGYKIKQLKECQLIRAAIFSV